MTTATSRDTPPRRVLVADGDPALLDHMTGILGRAGYATVPVTDGREAFRILRSDCDFVAAIFDAEMPHITGSDLANHMRTERRLMRIPVMIMSSAQATLQGTRDSSSGAAIFLPKPFTAEQLRLMLKVLECNRRAAPKRLAA